MALSDCAIFSGISNDCRDNVAGLKIVYIGEKSSLATFTHASGTVTAMTMSSGKKLWTYEQEFETATASDDLDPNAPNGSIQYLHKLALKFKKRSATNSYILRTLALRDLVAVVKDNNDNLYVLGGEFGIRMVQSPASFGTNLSDMNGYEVNFEGHEKYYAPQLPSNMLAALLSPA